MSTGPSALLLSILGRLFQMSSHFLCYLCIAFQKMNDYNGKAFRQTFAKRTAGTAAQRTLKITEE